MNTINTLSEYFNIDKSILESNGVFDRFIGVDSKLFVDPFLLDNLNIQEFKYSRDKIKDRFRKIIKLLSKDSDLAFDSAIKLITCKETKGIGIGYGNDTDDGNGIGPKLARAIAKTGKEIIELGINDTEIFELIGLFQKDFGPDRLSDITIDILKTDFLSYTSRIVKEVGIKSIKKYTDKNGNIFLLPLIKENGNIVLFLPKDCLRDLPISHDKDNIEHVVQFNQDLKNNLNKLIGDDWKKYIEKKENRKKEFFKDKRYIEELLEYYKNQDPISYDFEKDPKGEIDWKEKGIKIANLNPLKLTVKEISNINDIKKIVKQIIEQFQKNIEHNGANIFLKKGNNTFDEKYVQKLFFVVSDSYCNANNLDLSPESNASTGFVDFKMSNGLFKVIVEIKLTKNNINNGVAQLIEYEKGEGAIGIYLIIQTGEHQPKIDKFYEIEEEFKRDFKYFPEYYIIDGRIKPTPSNLRLDI